MEKLKVGQRIELFEIITSNWHGFGNPGNMPKGSIRPGIQFEKTGRSYEIGGKIVPIANTALVRSVGAMIVKKLKPKVPNIADGSLGPKVRPVSKYII